jgi:hypothetical protein
MAEIAVEFHHNNRITLVYTVYQNVDKRLYLIDSSLIVNRKFHGNDIINV